CPASSGRVHAGETTRCWRRRGGWRRRGSLVPLALGNGEHLRNVIDVWQQGPAGVDRRCPVSRPPLRRGVHAPKALAQRLVDQGLETRLPSGQGPLDKRI